MMTSVNLFSLFPSRPFQYYPESEWNGFGESMLISTDPSRSPRFSLRVSLYLWLLMFSSQWLMTKLASFRSFRNDGNNKSRLSLVLQLSSMTECLETCWEVFGLQWQLKAPDQNSFPLCLRSQFHMNLVLRTNETLPSSSRLTAPFSFIQISTNFRQTKDLSFSFPLLSRVIHHNE